MPAHVVVQDPNSISSRFSKFSSLSYDGENSSENELLKVIENRSSPDSLDDDFDSAIAKYSFSIIEPLLHRIPKREADLICLYYKEGMKQEQIARVFNITQAAVSYRLARGKRRIQFLRTIPLLDKEDFIEDFEPLCDDKQVKLFSNQDLDILWLMYETTCQSEIAKILNLTQGRVRHRFFRAVDKIATIIENEINEACAKMKTSDNDIDNEETVNDIIDNSKYQKYLKVFRAISDKKFNILHEVSLPQFKDRGDAVILTIG